ncbi:hypothetical protein EDC04DRAFT_2602949 [Pisolithus marmoratus]|nr:hypothetical protein EDC04DRAFT_2602949 [Pisolithus marmoratus]
MDLLAVRCARSRIGACQTVLCMRTTCVCICESGQLLALHRSWLTVSLIVDFVSLILAPLDRFLRANDYVHEWFGNRGMSFRWCRSRLVWPGCALAPPASASAVLASSMLGTTHFGAIWSHLRGCLCRHVHAHWILGVYYVVWHPSRACQARYPLAWKWQGRWNVSGIDFCLGMTMFCQAKCLVFWQMVQLSTFGLYVKWTISHLKVVGIDYLVDRNCIHSVTASNCGRLHRTWSGTLVVEDVRVNFAISAAIGAWRSPVKDSSVKMKILCAHEVVADMEAP